MIRVRIGGDQMIWVYWSLPARAINEIPSLPQSSQRLISGSTRAVSRCHRPRYSNPLATPKF